MYWRGARRAGGEEEGRERGKPSKREGREEGKKGRKGKNWL